MPGPPEGVFTRASTGKELGEKMNAPKGRKDRYYRIETGLCYLV